LPVFPSPGAELLRMSFEADEYGKRARPFLKDQQAAGKGIFLRDTDIAWRIRDFRRVTLDGREPLSGPDFPVVWRRPQTQEAA
jgi:hypothetical protein